MPIFLSSIIVPLLLAIGVLCLLEFGRKVGLRRREQGADATSGGAMEGAVFAIFGLLVAFTFSGAAARFEGRVALVGQEANDIGTAWLRLDLLPKDSQPALREDFRRYLDARLAAYRSAEDLPKAMGLLAEADKLQGVIWQRALAGCNAANSPAVTTLVVSALNSMFDIATTRLVSARTHPPLVIFALLVVLALVCAFLAGNGLATAKPNRLHAFGFSLVIAFTVYVIIDMEYPRLGLIRVDAADQVLIDLRAGMGPLAPAVPAISP